MLKQTLLAFTVLGFAGSAAAADITNPFFLPEEMHVASVTSFDYNHGHQKATAGDQSLSIRTYNKQATEQLQFGILNNLAIVGGISKSWDRATTSVFDRNDGPIFNGTDKSHNNLDWEVGLAWNILHCDTKLQVSSVYGQEEPGHGRGAYKYIDTTAKLGYQFKTWLPYATFTVRTPVAQSKKFGHEDRWSYNGKVGVYQGKCGVWGLDTALVWAFDRTDRHMRTLTAEAEASYYLTKNVTLGVYGSYMLDGKAKHDTDIFDKSVGARLRLYF